MKYKFPKVGMRMIKTTVAVFICLLITFVRAESVAIYSTISAILCMTPYLSNTKEVAVDRIIGTLIGGVTGMFMLMFLRTTASPLLVQYMLISVCMLPLIYLTLMIKQSSASAITCIVFLSITIATPLEITPFIIATSRTVDTLIGIMVALGVNAFHLPLRRNRNVLFVAELDDTLIHSDGTLGIYAEFQINRMIDDGEWFTIVTDRTPATLVPILDSLNLNLPVVAMNGAVLYDVKDRSYSFSMPMKPKVSNAVEAVIAQNGYNCFVHAIINETLHIYYGDFKNIAEERLYNRLRRTSHKNYIFGNPPEGTQAVNITVVNERATNKALRKQIEALDVRDEIAIVVSACMDEEGYTVMDIYSAEATGLNALLKMEKDLSIDHMIAFGSSTQSLPIFKAAYRAYAMDNAARVVKEAANKTIGSNDNDAVIKMMNRLFYKKRKLD